MKKKEFYIPCSGVNLHVKVDFPVMEMEKYPLVIVVHGLTGHMEEPHILAEVQALNEGGYATLRVELFGHGKSEGNFYDHTVILWVQELLQVIDYAAAFEWVKELYLTGHSQGGATVLLATALKQDKLKAIILQAPAMLIKEAALEGNMLGNVFDPDQVPEELQLNGRPVSGNYFRVNQLLPFKEATKCIYKPMQIIHSDADEMVPFFYAQRLKDEIAHAELVTIPGDNHVYEQQIGMVTEAMVEFLHRNGISGV